MKSKKLLIPSLIIIFLLSLCLNTYLENWNTSIKAANLKLSKGIEYYNIASNAYSIQDMDNITIYADKAIVELSTASVALENAMIEAQKSKKDWLILYTNYYLKKVQALKNAAVEIKILKEYFINEKVPKDMRDTMLLLTEDSHVIWAVGQRISADYKIDENTKKILEVHFFGGNYHESKEY